MASDKSFRNSAAFGKRIEYWIIGQMLKEGLDVYVPLVDDHAIDAIIKRSDGSTALIQIKARSKHVVDGDAALFAAIPHEEVRLNYWFIFYSERMDMMWIMTSEEFDREATKNKKERTWVYARYGSTVEALTRRQAKLLNTVSRNGRNTLPPISPESLMIPRKPAARVPNTGRTRRCTRPPTACALVASSRRSGFRRRVSLVVRLSRVAWLRALQ
jgi:hypothetical protein